VHTTGEHGARTVEYLDPTSGRTLARAFEPGGIASLQVVNGRGVMVTPAAGPGSYLIG